MASIQVRIVLGVALGLAVGCQAANAPSPRLTFDELPAALAEPGGLDWSFQRVSGRRLAARREAHLRRLLAYPSASAGWAGGVSLTQLGCGSADFVPNGPAAAYATSSTSALYNQVFFLSKEGKFIKVDRSKPGTYATLDLATSFSRTYVTLSPRCGRAYLLADDGSFFVIDTATMTRLASYDVGDGYGIAPFLDPYASKHDDSRDVLYVAANDGQVHKFVVTPSSGGASLAGPTSYAVATGVSPLYGETRKIKTSPVVLGGVIYAGDQAGNLQVYDTGDTANNYSFGVGAPINAPPSIEIQDGSYTLTDPNGNPKAVANGRPVYAFVSAGGSCAWINLHDTTITRSQGLRIDDNDNGKKFGYLLDYKYSTAGTTEYLAAEDGGNLNTESPERALPGKEPESRSNDYLVPAETNTYEQAGEAKGGPVHGFLRWRSTASHPAGSVINAAVLSLSPFADQACRVPEVRTSSAFYKGTNIPWASDGLTLSNRPGFGASNVGIFVSGGVNKQGNVTYKANKTYLWDVSAAFSEPAADGRYALGLRYNAGGDAVLWPEGPVGGGTGKKAKKDYQVEAVKFRNNPKNADTSPGTSNDKRPLLALQVAAATLPTPSIETPPMIDARRKKVYVFYTNALYELDYASPPAFSDTDPSGAKHTLFNLAHYGDTDNSGGGAFNGDKKFVGNVTAPVPNYDLSAMYMISRYPAPDQADPTTWNYALSKISLPLSSSADRRASGAPTFTGLGKEASNYLIVDPFTDAGTTGGNVYFGLGNGKIHQYDR
jgi:hypothetical protein